MDREYGNIMAIQSLALKMHMNILNYEVEAEKNYNTIIQIQMRDKYISYKENGSAISASKNLNMKLDGEFCIIIISVDPTNFHKINMVNKQLALMSGYDEKELYSNANVIMPRVIEEFHAQVVKKFITNKKTNADIKYIKTWLRHRDQTITPVNVKVHPNINFYRGLTLVGILSRQEKLCLFDSFIDVKNVFVLLCSKDDQLFHFSRNCYKYLNFSLEFMKNDVHMRDLFPQFQDLETSQLELGIDTVLCMENGVLQFREPNIKYGIRRNTLDVRLVLKKHTYFG